MPLIFIPNDELTGRTNAEKKVDDFESFEYADAVGIGTLVGPSEGWMGERDSFN